MRQRPHHHVIVQISRPRLRDKVAGKRWSYFGRRRRAKRHAL